MSDRDFPESRLYAPVRNWLLADGYVVHPEAWGHDVVAYKGERIVVVELKMAFTRTLYFQLIRASLFANSVFAGIKSKPRKSSLEVCRNHEFGILNVGEGVAVELSPPDSGRHMIQSHHDDALSALKAWVTPLDEVAGLPTLKGDGPAIRCAERIRKYLETRPMASWKEIFRDVPNHYAHHRSLRGAMPSIEYLKHPTPAQEDL